MTYSPPLGTVLFAGLQQALTVTAAATTDYNAATATVYIDVAGSVTLTGNGGNMSWSDPTNWGGQAPPSNVPVTFAGDGGTVTNDLTDGSSQNPLPVGGLTFQADAASFTLQGNAVALNGDIVNNSTNPQTVNLPLVLSADPTFNASAGNLLIGGNITGNNGVVTTGSETIVFSGQNGYTGDTTVLQGTLVAASAGAIPLDTGLIIGAGGTFIFDCTSPTGGAAVSTPVTQATAVAPQAPASTANAVAPSIAVSPSASVATMHPWSAVGVPPLGGSPAKAGTPAAAGAAMAAPLAAAVGHHVPIVDSRFTALARTASLGPAAPISASSPAAEPRAHDAAIQSAGFRPVAAELSWVSAAVDGSTFANQDKKRPAELQAVEALFATYER